MLVLDSIKCVIYSTHTITFECNILFYKKLKNNVDGILLLYDYIVFKNCTIIDYSPVKDDYMKIRLEYKGMDFPSKSEILSMIRKMKILEILK